MSASMSSMSAVHLIMSMESKQRKTKIIISSSVCAVICLIFAALFLARFASVQNLQS